MGQQSKPIEVYVELSGKEKFHKSLKGRDEQNQHPIEAITNLQENLDALQDSINENTEQIVAVTESTNNKLEQLEDTLTDTISDLSTDLNDKIDDLTESTARDVTNLNTKILAVKTELTNYTNIQLETLQNDLEEQISEIDLTAYYTKDETDEMLEGTFHYKGQVPDFDSLPVIHNEKGDVYNVQCSGANYVWTGYSWDNLSPTICLKGYATKDYVDGVVETSVRLLHGHLSVHFYDKEQIDEKLAKVFTYKGRVETFANLPTQDVKVGDVYITRDTSLKYFWAGHAWENFSQDLQSIYYTKNEIDYKLSEINDTISGQQGNIQELTDGLDALQDDVDDFKQQTRARLQIIEDNIEDLQNDPQKHWHYLGEL